MTRRTWATLIVIVAATVGCDDSKRSSRGSSGYPAGGGGTYGGGGGGGATPARAAELPPAKAAAVAWAEALGSGDVAKAKSLSVGDAARMKGLEQLVAAKVSEAKLEAVLKERFGPDETASTAGAPLPDEIRRSPVKDEGATVTIWAYVNDKPLIMKQQPDGGWKVDLTEIAADTGAARVLGRMHDKLAADVKAGKYKTSEEAWEAAGNSASAVADAVVEEIAAEEEAAAAATTAPAPPAARTAPAEGDGLE